MPWIRACSIDELPPGAAVRVETDPPVAVFNVDGEYFATSDTCTHEESSLAEGYIEGDQVECSFHFAKFCLRTGKALSPPARGDLQTFAVRVDDDTVFIEV